MTKQYNQRAYSVHPSSIIMVLLLVGITALFGALTWPISMPGSVQG